MMKSIFRTTAWILGATSIISACSLSDIVDVNKPQVGTDIDHDYLDTKAGALGLFNSSMISLQRVVSTTSLDVGLITDELTTRPYSASDKATDRMYSADTRLESEVVYGIRGIVAQAYPELHTTRIRAGYARYFLRRQADSTLNYAISAAYSAEGYAIVMLAENLCSGIPLSESPYGEKAVYGKAVSTDSLLSIAVAKFDSALAISHDSIRILTLAKIGKARALMSLKRYSDANMAVSGIQPTDAYSLSYTETIVPNAKVTSAFWTMASANAQSVTTYKRVEIVNREGVNGLTWYSDPAAIDPRLPVTVAGGIFPVVVRQEKYVNGNVNFKLASWVEAKMIEAEYLLNAGDADWIESINVARRTVGLPDTTAPASADQQVDLLFRERAFWFYAHGTRLSDMRRLVRQYGRDINRVFPSGPYNRHPEIYGYGDAVVFVPPAGEFKDNYNYSGCIHRNP